MTTSKIDAAFAAKDKLRKQIAALVDEYAALEYAERGFVPGSSAVPPSGKVIGAPELKKIWSMPRSMAG